MLPPAPDVLGDDGNHLDLSWISFNPVQQGEAVLEASATWTRSSLPSLGTTRPSWLVEALVSLARESGKHWEGSLPPFLLLIHIFNPRLSDIKCLQNPIMDCALFTYKTTCLACALQFSCLCIDDNYNNNQTWDLSEILHRQIFRPKLLHP